MLVTSGRDGGGGRAGDCSGEKELNERAGPARVFKEALRCAAILVLPRSRGSPWQ